MNEEKQNSEGKHLTSCPVSSEHGEFWCGILKLVIIGLIGFVVLIIVFGAGVKVGTLKARYSYRWAENYHKNFAGPRGGFFGDWREFPAGDFISGHGVFGSIIKIDGNTLIIKEENNIEKTVLILDKTTVTSRRETIKSNELKIDDRIIVIGSPDDQGQIEAKFIRVIR